MRSHAIVVAHREQMLGEGLAAALARFPGIVPVAVVSTAEEVRRIAERADALALDGQLAEAGSLAADMRRRGVRVVLLGRCAGQEDAAWVSTDAPISQLAASLVPALGQRPGCDSVPSLTRREQEILDLVAQGLAGKQVARQLGISPKTVEQHKTRIFAKLGVPNQTAAVSWVLGSLGGHHTPLRLTNSTSSA